MKVCLNYNSHVKFSKSKDEPSDSSTVWWIFFTLDVVLHLFILSLSSLFVDNHPNVWCTIGLRNNIHWSTLIGVTCNSRGQIPATKNNIFEKRGKWCLYWVWRWEATSLQTYNADIDCHIVLQLNHCVEWTALFGYFIERDLTLFGTTRTILYKE